MALDEMDPAARAQVVPQLPSGLYAASTNSDWTEYEAPALATEDFDSDTHIATAMINIKNIYTSFASLSLSVTAWRRMLATTSGLILESCFNTFPDFS